METHDVLDDLEKQFRGKVIPESTGYEKYDIPDGEYRMKVVTVGTRVTTGGHLQATIGFEVVSGSAKGNTPIASFQMAQDSEDENQPTTGLTILNDAIRRIGGDKVAYNDYGDLIAGLRSGEIERNLKGKECSVKASHNGQYLRLRVIRAIGPTIGQGRMPDLPVRRPASRTPIKKKARRK